MSGDEKSSSRQLVPLGGPESAKYAHFTANPAKNDRAGCHSDTGNAGKALLPQFLSSDKIGTYELFSIALSVANVEYRPGASLLSTVFAGR